MHSNVPMAQSSEAEEMTALSSPEVFVLEDSPTDLVEERAISEVSLLQTRLKMSEYSVAQFLVSHLSLQIIIVMYIGEFGLC